ncbi:MAG: DUF2333 family protein [Deltaproteobacteria bacterium]|nr:DUF2333 family protein [Deltaproteobacteria bacterium]
MQRLLPIAVAAALVAVLLIPLVLHFGQKSHNELSLDYAQLAPEGSKLGTSYASGVAAIMGNELEGTTGWRPNDLVIWGPTLMADNNASRQLGILQALRETTRVFKDHLTKVSSDQYDRNLVEAENLLRNDPDKWAFPSAESRYREAVERLQAYVEGLRAEPPKSRPINARNVELIRLIQAWSDMLGDAHADLLRDDVGWFQVDDVFYRTTGYCHVIAHMIPAIQIEYRQELDSRPVLQTLFDETEAPLLRCATMKPILVLNGGDTSPIANQRRNLDAYVTEGRQKLYSIREELEK